jgi:hypothetical protein
MITLSRRVALCGATSLFALATAAVVAATVPDARAETLIGLTNSNMIIRIDSESRRTTVAPLRVSGIEGRLLGIDQRPADGKLYGVTDAGQIVTIDWATGMASQVSRLSEPFESGGRAVVDFNPVADRLRLMGVNGTNFRVNVQTGQVARDGQLKYQQGSAWAETTPRITAGAYSNSMAGAQQTALYTLDTLTRSWNLQAPPNDGVQQPKAELPASLPPGVAFDIAADGQGGNVGWLLAAGTLHRVDVATGRVMATGAVTGLPAAEILDIAVVR